MSDDEAGLGGAWLGIRLKGIVNTKGVKRMEMNDDILIFDCEIEKAILGKNETAILGISYCNGWQDFDGMGLSVIGAYDYREDRYRVFCRDNFKDFQELVNNRSLVVGFNSLGFDIKLCAANGISIPAEKSYDILVEVWRAAGLGEIFNYPTHLGFGLDAICELNFGLSKTGNGALAPVWWQRGEIGAVIDYCLNDVKLTKMLLDHIKGWSPVWDPRTAPERTKLLNVRPPSVFLVGEGNQGHE